MASTDKNRLQIRDLKDTVFVSYSAVSYNIKKLVFYCLKHESYLAKKERGHASSPNPHPTCIAGPDNLTGLVGITVFFF